MKKGRTRIVEDSFKCRYKRGDGKCGLDGCCKCKKKCDKKYICSECSNSYIPYSQEPCASCYFKDKESMRQYIMDH